MFKYAISLLISVLVLTIGLPTSHANITPEQAELIGKAQKLEVDLMVKDPRQSFPADRLALYKANPLPADQTYFMVGDISKTDKIPTVAFVFSGRDKKIGIYLPHTEATRVTELIQLNKLRDILLKRYKASKYTEPDILPADHKISDLLFIIIEVEQTFTIEDVLDFAVNYLQYPAIMVGARDIDREIVEKSPLTFDNVELSKTTATVPSTD